MNQTTRSLLRWCIAGWLGLALSASTATAGPFSNLVVFGDSLSDVGNISQATFGIVPGRYYSNGRFSNGAVYAETLAAGLGLPFLTRSTAGGNDFAYGGAQTSGTGGFYGPFIRDINEQVDLFLATRTADPNALYLVWAGANDLLGGQTTVSIPVGQLQQDIGRLVTAGARQFLVFNLPPLGSTPRFNNNSDDKKEYNCRSEKFNDALAEMLDGFETLNPAVTVHQFDVYALFNATLNDPAAYGLTNATMSAAPGLTPGASSYSGQIAAHQNEYLFWDDVHPTAAVHAILAQRALDLFRLPGDFNRDNVVNSADYVTWRNGLGTTYIPADYEIWRSHFGMTVGSEGSAAWSSASLVPEPAGNFFPVMALGSIMIAFTARRSPATRIAN